MKNSLSIIFSFILILGGSLDLEAQRKRKFKPKYRFNAGIVAGMNFSQIDGDNYVGYDQLGIQAGARGIAKLTPHLDLAVEMLFVQKGSLDRDERINGRKYRQISLNYIEVPFLLHAHYLNNHQIKISIEGGISFGRMIGYSIHELTNGRDYIPFATVENDFNRNEWSAIIGGGFYLNKHIRVFVRHNVALNFLYEKPTPDPNAPIVTPTTPTYFWTTSFHNTDISRLRNYQFSLNCNYMF
jgi:hypothetical protein